MKPVLTAARMRDMDARTIRDMGIPGSVLMENAGRAVAALVERHLADLYPAPESPATVAVLCGAGNNGGDGFVVGRVLREHGYRLNLYCAAPRENLKGDAELHANAYERCGGLVTDIRDAERLKQNADEIEAADVVVDALFGTGLSREPTGHWAQLIALLNRSEAHVVAVDIPSGLRADDGLILGSCVNADQTLSLACAKVANVSAPGYLACGQLEIAEIGIPGDILSEAAEIGVLELEDVRDAFHRRAEDGHKASRGHALVFAGSPGKRGAGRLAGLSALRGGTGLVTLVAEKPDENAEAPLMTAGASSAKELIALCAGKSALLMGPGMSTTAKAGHMLREVLEQISLPTVLDADALNHLGTELELVVASAAPMVLTPHPGEASRLLGIPIEVLQSDRVAAARELALQSRAVVILKGARTCICDGREPSHFVAINPTGGPELSTAGTGDVLGGLVASLLAQGLDPLLAARAAVYWHGCAGRDALAALGGPGVIASDLLAAIPVARGRFERR